jgi:hypothetical protein
MGTYYIPDELIIRISKLGLDIHSFIRKSLITAVEIEENKREVKTNG